jgi:hypothetical protein
VDIPVCVILLLGISFVHSCGDCVASLLLADWL